MDVPSPISRPAGLDLTLFQHTSHSPSYASLTNNFEHASKVVE